MSATGNSHGQDASLAARIGLAVGATLVFLLAMELLARGFEAVSPPDAALIEAHRPKRTPLPDPIPGAYRIHLFGGSTVAGTPLPELSFATQLGFWLERLAPERPVQIVNFGVNARPSAYVLAEMERSLPSGPDLNIVLTAHNEFMRWEPDGRLERLRERTGRVLEQTALARTLRRIGEPLSALTPGSTSIRRPGWIDPVDREGEAFRERLRVYRRNTADIVARSREAGAPLVLATGPANLADWPPVYRFLHDREYGRAVEAVRRHLEQHDLEAAAAGLAALREAHPSDAMVSWLEGRLAQAEGRPREAAALFDAARDADPQPWRVFGVFNDHLRRLARESEGVFLADLDRAFRREAPDGLVGFDLVADNCHPTPFGNAVIVRELLGVMAREGLLLRGLEGLPPLESQWETFREAALRERPDLWTEYLIANAVYVMKWPFFNFEAARDYLEQARALAPRDWRVPANLGTVAVLEGHVEEGRRELERAAELHGGSLREHERGPTPYLREAMAILSGELEAFVPIETRESGGAG